MSATPLCEESVYSKVFLEYSPTLFNYLYYKCGDAALAKDLTHVFKVANNAMLNTFEKQKVRLRFQQIKPKAHTNESPEFLMEQQELHTQIENAISELPEKQRVVFLLSRIDKKTYKEIAEIIGISKQAVEKRIYNALDTLRKVSKNIR